MTVDTEGLAFELVGNGLVWFGLSVCVHAPMLIL
jgi:hypothetical protein